MHMHTTSLVIDNVKEKDSGSYKVMAINTEGSAESTASLLVSLREEQSANYLGFIKRSAKAHESVDTIAEQRKERKFRVDLRCVGSPFDKMSKVHQGRSRSKSSLVRTVYFRSGSHSKEKESEKESKHLETASERAPSPPLMFDRSERFNDRFSDIYCDRRTGARFSDKFSDRCSDRYSERFSDTESLHNEVRTKLTTLQKAVKQKKRLSICTMSSSEFELESVASESSYADYVERLRVKPASLPDVQHFNRPLDLRETNREFQGKTSSGHPSQPRVRHSFEPQSRTRAIQIMRGELVDTFVPQTERKSGEKYSQSLEDKDVENFNQADVRLKEKVFEHHSAVADHKMEATKPEAPYSETTAYPETTAYSESREHLVTSTREKFHREALTPEDIVKTETVEPYEEECAGESLRAQYEKSLEAERMECEEKLLALRIRKWQQGNRASEEETFHPETDLPMPTETQYMEPEGHIYTQQEVIEKSAIVVPSSFLKSAIMKARLIEPEAAIASTPKSPKLKARGEVETPSLPAKSARAADVEAELSPRAKARTKEGLRESPRPRPVRSVKGKLLSEVVTPHGIATETVEPYEEECTGESLRAHYEESLEAELMECEEKLLALRIRKWQQGMQMSEEETFHPETDLPMVAETPYMAPGGNIYTFQQEVVEKIADVGHATTSTPKSPKVKSRVEQDKTTVMLAQKSPRVNARAAEVKAESSPGTKARAEKLLFERTREDRELQLSRENISELKNESEKFVSEEEALAQRILKWQQDVLMEQEQAVKLESDWVDGYSTIQAERTTEAGRNVAEASALESILQPEVICGRKTSPKKTAKEKFLLSESVPAGFQDQQGETLQWPPAGELPTEGRETRLQRDSEYFVSEEEALAQRILKWQQDVVEQEEVAELESEWALDSQCKQSGSRLPFETISPFDSEPHHVGISHETHPTDPRASHTSIPGEVLQTKKSSSPQYTAGYESSPPHESSFITRYSPAHPGLPHHAGVPVERSCVLKTTPVKDTMGLEASSVQRYSPTQLTGVPFGGYELVSAQGESPHEPSQEFSSVRRRSPCRSPPEHLQRAAERKWSREEYTVTVDKSSSQRFQSEMREQMGMREELGTTRESSEWRQQKDFADVRREERREDLIRSQQGGEMSTESQELWAIKKDEERVQQESNLKEGVYQSQESKMVKEGDTSARGSRPVFVKEISSVKVKIGEMSEFTCQFNGAPLPTVTWLKDGHPLAHNPDYDIISKSNKSKLTIFYPTTDHEGTYDCVIDNKHGKSICSATLEISDKKMRMSGVRHGVVVTEELETGEENQESLMEEELQSYMDSGKATLQVPQAVIHRPHRSDESLSSSAVEIRITAPTPVLEVTEEGIDDKPQAFTEKPSGVASDEGASQTVKHKFTFSFDVVSEGPHVISELENITCSEGNTAVLECVITGEPAPNVEWYCDDVCLEITGGKYRVEVDDKVYRLCINSFTYIDAGVYKCVARNKLGEVTSISDVSFQVAEPVQFSKGGGTVEDDVFHKAGISHTKDHIIHMKHKPMSSQAPSEAAAEATKSRPGFSREPLALSGCGLQASAAVIKVSQIKQAFESDSPVALMTPPSPEEQRKKETLFPEEFIPAVANSLDQQEQVIAPKHDFIYAEDGTAVNPGSPKAIPNVTQTLPVEAKSVSSKTSQFTTSHEEDSEICVTPGDVEEGVVLKESHSAVKQFVEVVQESPELVRPKPQKPVCLPVQREAGEGEGKMVREDPVPTHFDRTSSFIQFQSEKVPAVKHSIRTSALPEVVKPKRISESLKTEKQSASVRPPSIHDEAEIFCGTSDGFTEVEKQDIKVSTEGYDLNLGLKHVSEDLELTGGELVSIPELSLDKHVRSELITIPEPSLDSGVFLSIPDSQADITKVAEGIVADDVVDPHRQSMSEDVPVKAEPKPLTVKPKVDTVGRFKPLGLPVNATAQGQERGSSGRSSATEAGGAAATVGSMEEEEVTFGAVYDYYNPPADWGRPLSPESEMSIEIGSTVSEEIAEVAERFYTPGSSTEVSQPIAESFHTPKSPMSYHTPSSDTPGGFMTPQEYPFSPVEHKRPSTGDSSERFFSPVQFLTSPADEGIETTPLGINMDESQFLTRGRGSLALQEKVQGIPPAFLKPLIKKRVFENDSLKFCAEVFGLPSPEVKWFCNKTQLVADDRVKIERDADTISLTIHNVNKADQGEYICEAVNYVGEARSVALVVVVSQEVRFMPAPPAVTHQHVMEFDVEEDDSSRSPSPQEILLEVELDENEVKEFEKQVKIITIPEYTADNKSMIISLDVLPSIYEESAVDFVTQEHDDLKIAFEVTEMPPRFINPICDMETPEGTTVMFECSLMGIPSPIVSWFKGDKKIPHNNKKYLHSSDGDNHFLKICKVSTQDSGVYTCRAINVVGETLCRASLVVLNAKAFSGKTRGRELTAVSLGSAKLQPQKFDLMVGNTSFDGEQVSEIELEFEFEQEADESQRAVRLVANTDNELSEQGDTYVSINFDVFAEPAKDDKIEFKGKSSDMCSFQFQVTETPPKCVIPLTDITAAAGTPVILQCLVSGKPNPTAEWYKDGDHVADSRCIIQEKTAGHFNLLITNVTQSDAGEYKCIINNTAGCIETTALLKVF
ncbi:muscle M-line assembly protein unc-89-like [Trachinotus anak]|uniref:muscle M-line assembly protein unc-89-like n=1 Tax=Trachinotus anak TaxID=443729 RepID=UPI0039F170CE